MWENLFLNLSEEVHKVLKGKNDLSFVLLTSNLLWLVPTVRIGLLYVVSGFGGSMLSSLFIQSSISVGASGALFGLLGGMLSELITNWTIYANKVIKKMLSRN